MAELVYTRSYFYPTNFVARIIDIVVGVIELLLTLRFVLELLGADPAASFIAWIYNTSGTLVAPFSGAFPSFVLGGASVIDFSAILAMIVYGILGWLAVRLFSLVLTAFSPEA